MTKNEPWWIDWLKVLTAVLFGFIICLLSPLMSQETKKPEVQKLTVEEVYKQLVTSAGPLSQQDVVGLLKDNGFVEVPKDVEDQTKIGKPMTYTVTGEFHLKWFHTVDHEVTCYFDKHDRLTHLYSFGAAHRFVHPAIPVGDQESK